MDPADVDISLQVDDNRVSQCLGAFPIRARVIYLCPTKLMFDALRVHHLGRPHPD